MEKGHEDMPVAKQPELERVLRAIEKTGAHMSMHLMSDGSIKLVPVSNDDTPKIELKSDIVL